MADLARTRRLSKRSQSGFALLVVIWGLGIIALLIVSFMKTSRWDLQVASNVAGSAAASLLAKSAINLGLLDLGSGARAHAEMA